jgi:ethanolamine utilization protein EutN
MFLGRVVGRVWATVKNATLDGQRMLVVQPLTPELQTTGKRLICLDWTGAGAGEIVYWVRGREASIALLPAEPPIDTTVVGIVDTIHLRTAPGGGQTGETGAQAGPERVQAGPQGVGTGETAAQAAPMGGQTGESGTPAAPQGMQSGEARAQSTPARVEARGTRIESAPIGAHAGETGAQPVPMGAQTAETRAQPAPQDPAPPGATRTPAHRKGRRC